MITSIFHLLILVLIPVFGFCYEKATPMPIPSDLMYEGKSIPEDVLKNFFGLSIIGYFTPDLELDLPSCFTKQIPSQENLDDEEFTKVEVSFDWEYFGTLYQHFHAIRIYRWEAGCIGKFTGILLLKREGNKLRITDIIFGGDRHSSCIHEGSCKIKGNKIHYSQGATTGSLVDQALQQFPDLDPFYNKSSKNGICYGEACATGYFEYEADINPEGEVKEIKLINFVACEGDDEMSEAYQKGGLKAVALKLLEDKED